MDLTKETALLPHEAERNPIVFTRDGEVFANSRDVAAYFSKQHAHVLRDIDALLKSAPELGLSNFGEGYYTLPATGSQQHRAFDMDRQGFELLAMGFTGNKALRWKIAYVRAFKTMEDALRKPAVIDFSDPKIALGFIEHLTGKVQEQEAIIVEQGGRLKKLDRIEAAGGSMCLTDAAKTLKVRPQELIRFMQSRGFIYKRVGNTAWIGRQEKIQTGYLEHREHVYIDREGHERVATQVLVTAKGLVKLSELLEQPPH